MNSPCVAACKNEDGICTGCHRTINEIVEWRHYDDAQRQAIIDRLSGDVVTHQCPSCNQPAHCDISAGKSTCWCFDIDKRDLSSEPKSDTCLCRKCLSSLPVA